VKPLLSLVLGWLATGFGAVVGSIVGNAGGKGGLAFGAIAGGVLGVLVAVNLARRLSWVPSSEVPGALIMHSPLVPILSCSLAGVGILMGAGVSRGWSRP
jgi:hypothetical protein